MPTSKTPVHVAFYYHVLILGALIINGACIAGLIARHDAWAFMPLGSPPGKLALFIFDIVVVIAFITRRLFRPHDGGRPSDDW